jgi:hypothetical protein
MLWGNQNMLSSKSEAICVVGQPEHTERKERGNLCCGATRTHRACEAIRVVGQPEHEERKDSRASP